MLTAPSSRRVLGTGGDVKLSREGIWNRRPAVYELGLPFPDSAFSIGCLAIHRH